MRPTRTRNVPPTHESTATLMCLDELERTLSRGPGRLPGSTVVMRETARALNVLSSGETFATLTGERCADGVRIVEGREALEVVRSLRARASRRGEHFWALELGRRIRFRIVVRDAGTAGTSARPVARRGVRHGIRAARLIMS